MFKLIVANNEPLEIGKVHRGDLRDPFGNTHKDQPYLVVKESTRMEWVECIVSAGLERGLAETASHWDKYFYEIQID